MTTTIASKKFTHSLSVSSLTKKNDSTWFGRSITAPLPSASVSSTEKQRALLNKVPGSIEPGLTELGIYGQEATSALSIAMREGIALPIPQWQQVPLYPDGHHSILFQSLGFSTAMYTPLGLHGLCHASHDLAKGIQRDDSYGSAMGAMDVGSMLGEVGLGAGYAGIHATGMGEILHEGNHTWTHLKDQFEVIGNAFASAAYGFFAIKEGLQEHESAQFEKDFRKTADKTKFVKERLGFDGKKLEKEAHKGKTNTDFTKAALDNLRPLAKRNLRLLEKQGKIRLPFWLSAEKVDRFVKAYLGNKELIQLGKEVVKKDLKAFKKEKLVRVLGSEETLEKVEHAAKKGKSKDVEKIVLANLKTNSSERWKRIAMYSIGAVSLGLMCYFTAGLPLIILTLIFVGVAAREVAMFLGKIRHEAQEQSAPGRYDHWIPWMNIAFVAAGIVVSGALLAASVGTFGMLPLAIGLVVGAVWIGLNIYHKQKIDQRRENYLECLLQKKQLNLREFEYLLKYRKLQEAQLLKTLSKLPKEDRDAIGKFATKVQGKNLRARLRKAIVQRVQQLEMKQADRFWKAAGKSLPMVFA